MLRAATASILLTGLLMVPAPTDAAGVSIEEDVFSAPDGVFNLCWLRPRRSSKKDLRRLTKALEIAARNTQPAHVDGRLIRIRSRRRDAPKQNCRVVLDVTAKGPRKRRRFVLDIYELGEKTPLETQTVGPVHAGRVDAAPFEPPFAKLWKAVSPPPPPPPPEPEPETSYVDAEIATERVRLAPVEAPEAPALPVASVAFVSGLLMRSIDADLGTPQSDAQLVSVGGWGALHLAGLFGAERHDFDVVAAYARQIAHAERAGESYGVSSDRIDIGARYRFHLPHPYLPRVGLRAGFQRLRFEVADEAGALSVRYGVVRGGLSIVQPLVVSSSFDLMLDVDGGPRWAPATSAVAALGWDAGAAVRLVFPVGAFASVRGRALEQRGVENSFRDRFIDVDVAVGWSL